MSDRRDYLLAMADRLWPEGGEQAFLVIPSLERPRLILPANERKAALAALNGRRGIRFAALRWALMLGLVRSRLRVGTGIEQHLAGFLGQQPLVAMPVGPPRANRKPVLHLLDRQGKSLGFAKIGINPLTERLINAETSALHRIAEKDFQRVQAPRVLHHGSWRDLGILVQSGLPTQGAKAPSAAALTAAMLEVAGPPRTTTLGESECVAQLIEALSNLGSAGAEMADYLVQIRSAEPEKVFELGAWHGDWTAWNCAAAAQADQVLVWDWERYTEGVPRGFDALHHHFHGSGRIDEAAARELISQAPLLIKPFGGNELTAVLYLSEIAKRYLNDGQAEAGGRRGDVSAWLVPAVRDYAQHLTPQRR